MSITDSACNKASRPIKKEAIANIAKTTGDIWVDDAGAYGLEWLEFCLMLLRLVVTA